MVIDEDVLLLDKEEEEDEDVKHETQLLLLLDEQEVEFSEDELAVVELFAEQVEVEIDEPNVFS